MTTLADRPNTALLVIDVQNDVVGGAPRRDDVVANINTLVSRARDAQVPVVWVQWNAEGELDYGSEGWQIVDELSPAPEESVVHKQYCDAFEGTDMEDQLARLGAGHLFVTGAETDACIRGTIHGGFARGYDVTLVSDAHTASDKTEWGAPSVDDIIAHTNMSWQFQGGPGRTTAVLATDEVSF